MAESDQPGHFRVFWRGEWPKPKRVYYPGTFAKRQQARQWCRNHGAGLEGLTIEHPDGTREPWRGHG